MTRRKQLIYLVGPPGAGKSSLMTRLTDRWSRTPAPEGLSRDWLTDPQTSCLEAVELGKRRPSFSGTDALGQSVIGEAITWMLQQSEADLVFAEGARLGNRRFLGTAAAGGYAVLLGYLEHPYTEAWRSARALALGREQNPVWVRGRATAARNLANDPPDGVTVVSGHPDILLYEIQGLIHERQSL